LKNFPLSIYLNQTTLDPSTFFKFGLCRRPPGIFAQPEVDDNLMNN